MGAALKTAADLLWAVNEVRTYLVELKEECGMCIERGEFLDAEVLMRELSHQVSKLDDVRKNVLSPESERQ